MSQEGLLFCSRLIHLFFNLKKELLSLGDNGQLLHLLPVVEEVFGRVSRFVEVGLQDGLVVYHKLRNQEFEISLWRERVRSALFSEKIIQGGYLLKITLDAYPVTDEADYADELAHFVVVQMPVLDDQPNNFIELRDTGIEFF